MMLAIVAFFHGNRISSKRLEPSANADRPEQSLALPTSLPSLEQHMHAHLRFLPVHSELIMGLWYFGFDLPTCQEITKRIREYWGDYAFQSNKNPMSESHQITEGIKNRNPTVTDNKTPARIDDTIPTKSLVFTASKKTILEKLFHQASI